MHLCTGRQAAKESAISPILLSVLGLVLESETSPKTTGLDLEREHADLRDWQLANPFIVGVKPLMLRGEAHHPLVLDNELEGN